MNENNNKLIPNLEQMRRHSVHLGHLRRYSNPQMKKLYVLKEIKKFDIIDCHSTISCMKRALAFLSDLVQNKGTVLFFSTKSLTRNLVRDYATLCGMPYLNQRWIGGLLTNFSCTSRPVQQLHYLDEDTKHQEIDNLTKKELNFLRRKHARLEKVIGGIKYMKQVPDALIMMDTKKSQSAVREANKMCIPIIGIVDSNCSPHKIDYPIPGNDDSTKAVTLYLKVLSQCIITAQKRSSDDIKEHEEGN